MVDLLEVASAIMRSSERRVEVVASNVANISTPGFRRQIAYNDMISPSAAGGRFPLAINTRIDAAAGRLTETRSPLDIAINGAGYFQLSDGAAMLYSRQGQFSRLEDGRVADANGHVLQQAGGGDLVIDSTDVQILADGIVVQDGRPVARIALFEPDEGGRLDPVSGTFFAMAGEAREVDAPQLRQGMVETSNVVLGDEMVAMMAAVRQAEGGARLAMLYDELAGRAIQVLGQVQAGSR